MNVEAIITIAIALSGIVLFLGAVLAVMERQAKRTDELERFRRTIEAMRRMEQQEDHR